MNEIVSFEIEDNELKEQIMIKMKMNDGERDVVMIVMGIGKIFGEVEGNVIIGVDQK